MAKKQNPFPTRLKDARKAYGISQKQLGIAIGIDEFSASARMNQYETGKHAPDYLTVEHIAEFLNYPVSYLYEPNNELAELIRLYSNLNKIKRNAVMKFIDNLYDLSN